MGMWSNSNGDWIRGLDRSETDEVKKMNASQQRRWEWSSRKKTQNHTKTSKLRKFYSHWRFEQWKHLLILFYVHVLIRTHAIDYIQSYIIAGCVSYEDTDKTKGWYICRKVHYNLARHFYVISGTPHQLFGGPYTRQCSTLNLNNSQKNDTPSRRKNMESHNVASSSPQ